MDEPKKPTMRWPTPVVLLVVTCLACLTVMNDHLFLVRSVVGADDAAGCANDLHMLCDGRCCRRVCLNGMAVVPKAVAHAASEFYANSATLPMAAQRGWLGTHNSAISYAHGVGLCDAALEHATGMRWVTANQVLGITDQMRLGVRLLELDVHLHDGQLKLCHTFSADIPDLDAVLSMASERLLRRPLHWDALSTGCFGGPYELAYSAALHIVADFLRTHILHVPVIIMLDDDAAMKHHEAANMLRNQSMALGNALITPGALPIAALLATPAARLAGKVILVSRVDSPLLVDLAYPRAALHGWTEVSPAALQRDHALFCGALHDNWQRHQASATQFGVFYDGRVSKGTWTPHAMQRAIDCPAAFVSLDHLTASSAATYWRQVMVSNVSHAAYIQVADTSLLTM